MEKTARIPYLLWLKKEEIDTLIALLIKALDSHAELDTSKTFEEVLEMNSQLITILKAIEPLNPISKNDIESFRNVKNCQDLKSRMAWLLSKTCRADEAEKRKLLNQIEQLPSCNYCSKECVLRPPDS